MKCAMCGDNRTTVDDKMGERVCDSCGYVLVENLFEERSPALKTAWNNTTGTNEAMPSHERTSSYGLGSVIGNQGFIRGEYNTRVSRRLMKTQKIFRDRTEQSIQSGIMECMMVLSPHLPNPSLKEQVVEYYRRMFKARTLFGFTISVRACAIVFVVLKERGIAITVSQISKANNENPQQVSRCARKIARVWLRKPWILHEMPIMSWLDLAGTNLQASKGFMKDARKVINYNYEFVNDRNIHFGKGLLSASLWMVSVMRAHGSYPEYTQHQIVAACDCTTVTLRNRHRDLLAMLGMDKKQFKVMTIDEYVAGVRYG